MTDLKMVSINVSPLIRAGSNETPAKILNIRVIKSGRKGVLGC